MWIELKEFFYKLLSLVGVIIVFLIVNLILLFGQELYYGYKNRNIDELKNKMNDLINEKQQLESKLEFLENQYIKQKGENNSSKYSNILIDDYNITYNKYTNIVDKYNLLLDEYENSDKDSGRRFFLIPKRMGH